MSVDVQEASPAVWPTLPPGKPLNLSVTVRHSHAFIRWKHAPPVDGGLATHYVAKWQPKDDVEASWFPEYLGVGDELVTLSDLTPGATYGIRVAAINKQGRAWSELAAFTMLTGMKCDGSWHWGQLMSND